MRIISGTLFVQSYDETANPGEYEISGATYENVADATGNGAFDLDDSFLLYVPAADPNTFAPVPGVVHRFRFVSLTVVNANTINGVVAFDEGGPEVDKPLSGSLAIITEKGAGLGLGFGVSQQVYPNLLSGADLNAVVIDKKVKIDGVAAGGVGGSGTAGAIAMFTSGTEIGDSVISQAGTAVTVAGDLTSAGLLVASRASSDELGTGDITLGDPGAAHASLGHFDGQYLWIQSRGGLPLKINRLGNNVTFSESGGSVGIGTEPSGAKLHLAGTLKLVDGSQGAGKVLTSDADGLASWQDAPAGGGISGSGTTGAIAKFTSGTEIGDSVMVEDGGRIGVGVTPVTIGGIENLSLQSQNGIVVHHDAAQEGGDLLFVDGALATKGELFVRDTGDVELLAWGGGLDFYTGNGDLRARILAGGDFVIGPGTSAAKLTVTSEGGGNPLVLRNSNESVVAEVNNSGLTSLTNHAGGQVLNVRSSTSTPDQLIAKFAYDNDAVFVHGDRLLLGGGVNLEVSDGTFKLVDGSQGAGKVLTSDADGLASWQTLPTPPATPTTETAVSAETSKVVTHNLGYRPIVQVLDDSGVFVLPDTLTHNSVNQFTVTFASAFTGTILHR